MREGAWLTATVALFLLSFLLRQSLLFTISLALLLAAVSARLWNRYCFAGLEYRREISPRRAFLGEEVERTTEVVNRKLLPLAWLEVEDELPDELELVGGHPAPSHRPRRYQLTNLLALRWYERVRRRHRLRCTARGHFALGPVHMRSGDIFGLAMNESEREVPDQVLVYPKVVPVASLGLPSVHPFGDMRIRQQLFEDPLRTVGVRPYSYGDSMRRVHWKATARTHEIQVRVYEATKTLRLIVFLNMNTFGPRWWWQAQDPATLELGITVAASVAKWGIEQGYQVGLYANGSARQSDEKMKIPPGRDPSQLVRVLEALAKVMPFATAPVEDLLRVESQNLPWGSTLVVVTAIVTDELANILENLRAAGHKVVLLLIGEGRGSGSDDLSRHYVGAGSGSDDLSRYYGTPPAVGGDASRYYPEAPPTERELWGKPSAPGVPAGGKVGSGGGARPGAATLQLPRLKGIDIHRVKVTWREIRDLQLD
ncbi:MAG: DUF58 domain-containing protein [Chloroflexi bacterium]|nr:DUF58 domain-containing protein [Chloroflexota bacterium]